ncbi:MAG: VWA-like domain-containing protein, partial [Gammaproteobacteria bacterium]|nr:VWA-like domain-containing protein [Gammaproteobacteria bacterium]
LTVQWQQRLAGAAQQAMQAGKLDGEMARMVDFLLQPQLPWRNLVSRYLNSIARDDYSYTRPSTRRGDPAIYPSLRSAQLDIAIAIDTSGSISQNEIQEFVSEIDSLKGQMRARVTLIACDSELAEGCPWIYEPWEEFSLPKSIKGGGGTRFTPVFDWANKQDKMPDILVYFTDADGEFPNVEPAFDVLWLIKGKSKVPWGQRVQLN